MIDAGLEVLFDDRKVRAGFMFADMELIGIPHRVVLGDSCTVEHRGRRDAESREIPMGEIVGFLKNVDAVTKEPHRSRWKA